MSCGYRTYYDPDHASPSAYRCFSATETAEKVGLSLDELQAATKRRDIVHHASAGKHRYTEIAIAEYLRRREGARVA